MLLEAEGLKKFSLLNNPWVQSPCLGVWQQKPAMALCPHPAFGPVQKLHYLLYVVILAVKFNNLSVPLFWGHFLKFPNQSRTLKYMCLDTNGNKLTHASPFLLSHWTLWWRWTCTDDENHFTRRGTESGGAYKPGLKSSPLVWEMPAW